MDAVAAAGLAYPLYSVAGIVYGCIGTGFKSMALQRIVRSDMEGFQRIYSMSVLLSVLISLIINPPVLEYDRKIAETGDIGLCAEANEKLCEMAKEQTQKTLTAVLHESSVTMKNGYNRADN